MLALTVAIISTTCFTLIIRHSQRAGYDQMAIMMLSYTAAGVTGFLLGGQGEISPHTWMVGGIGGCIFVTTYLLFIQSLHLKGVAIANAITRLSVLVPVLGTILIFGEKPHPIEMLGAVLAMGAMPLLSLDRGFDGGGVTRRQVPLLATLFVANGACLLVNKWFHATGAAAERPAFLGILFGTAAVVSTVVWAVTSRRLGWREVVWGVPLGVINCLTSFMLIRALDTLAGCLVFPVQAALGLVLTTTFAALIWREVPGRLGRAGLVVALAAVVLINL